MNTSNQPQGAKDPYSIRVSVPDCGSWTCSTDAQEGKTPEYGRVDWGDRETHPLTNVRGANLFSLVPVISSPAIYDGEFGSGMEYTLQRTSLTKGQVLEIAIT